MRISDWSSDVCSSDLISRMAWVGAAPPTLWIVNQALASGVGFPDIRGVGGVAPTSGFVEARPTRKDSRKAAKRPASIARRLPDHSDWSYQRSGWSRVGNEWVSKCKALWYPGNH